MHSMGWLTEHEGERGKSEKAMLRILLGYCAL